MNKNIDSKILQVLKSELTRQKKHIELIASENYVSEAILKISGSVCTNKYAEGYPDKRYYGGCDNIDILEQLAIDTVKKIYNADHANVQPHSGSQANQAVYFALLQPGDKVVGMQLDAGGHLTHGHPLNFSGKTYSFYGYGVDKTTEMIDYDAVRNLVLEVKPKLLIAGASAYSKSIDFAKFRTIADEVNAYLMVDMAHIAGLIAADLHQNPVEFADVVTSTTHKTLRGPRGGLILCKENLAKKIDSAVFPGIQGGPLENTIAAKAQCFLEALSDDFKTYQIQVIKNAQTLASELKTQGFRIVADGTDNHLLMVNVKSSINMTGKVAEQTLQSIGIICNKNMIPFDKEKPMITSGIRLGTATMTTRGFKTEEFKQVAQIIALALKNADNKEQLMMLQIEVNQLLDKFPIYEEIEY